MIDRLYAYARSKAIAGRRPGWAHFLWRLQWWATKPVVYPLEMRWLRGRIDTLEMYLKYAEGKADALRRLNDEYDFRLKQAGLLREKP